MVRRFPGLAHLLQPLLRGQLPEQFEVNTEEGPDWWDELSSQTDGSCPGGTQMLNHGGAGYSMIPCLTARQQAGGW